MFGSGQLQAPLRQTEFPGHCSLFVQATAPPQDLRKSQTFVGLCPFIKHHTIDLGGYKAKPASLLVVLALVALAIFRSTRAWSVYLKKVILATELLSPVKCLVKAKFLASRKLNYLVFKLGLPIDIP